MFCKYFTDLDFSICFLSFYYRVKQHICTIFNHKINFINHNPNTFVAWKDHDASKDIFFISNLFLWHRNRYRIPYFWQFLDHFKEILFKKKLTKNSLDDGLYIRRYLFKWSNIFFLFSNKLEWVFSKIYLSCLCVLYCKNTYFHI